MKGKKGHKAKWFILASILLSACSGESADETPSPATSDEEIRFNAEVWHMMEGTRTTFFGSGTQSSGSFTCTAYTENTTDYNPESNINASTVVWSSGHWEFGSHRWPNSNALDFFAYMPQYDSKPSYISSITYAVSLEPAPAPSFVCSDLPMTYNSDSPTAGQGRGLQEFVWAMTIGQNKTDQGESGVTMKFRHPFARIKFQLAANNPNITINSITLKGLKTGGTCTFTNTDIAETYYYKTSSWSSLTGSSNFVMTLSGNAATFNDNPASAVPIGGYADSQHTGVDLIMIPQSWAGAIDVNVTWDNWGSPKTETLSTTAATDWQSGYSYTYTFTINKSALIVDVNKFTEQW
jgi:hypothetical protein